MKHLKHLFSGRLNRRNYFVGMFVLIVIFILWYWFSYTLRLPAVGVVILGIITWILTFAMKVRRLHDIGYSGWFVLLLLIPYINFILELVLLFVPGSIKVNKYGPLPRPIMSLHDAFTLK